jgi:hypothetical protein
MKRFSVLIWVWAAVGSQIVSSHGRIGDRMFVEPLVTEDAVVKNEVVLPFLEFLKKPEGTRRSAGFTIEKTLYPAKFSIIFELERTRNVDAGQRFSAWENVELGSKWQAAQSTRHEFVLSPAFFVSLPTASRKLGPRQAAIRPMLLLGKGFGDLSPNWVRPFAFQGDLGCEASVTGPRDREIVYDGVLTYSIPYLNQFLRKSNAGYSLEEGLRQGFSRGALLGNLFPFVEFTNSSSLQHRGTYSVIRPGILWMGKYAQVTVAADFTARMPEGGLRRTRGFSIIIDWYMEELSPAFTWTPFGKHP